MTTTTTNHADAINFLFGNAGHILADSENLSFVYNVRLDASRCGLAAAIGELRSISLRLHIAADQLEGKPQRRTGDESHLAKLTGLTAKQVCNRLESAHDAIEAVQDGDGISLAIDVIRPTDGTLACTVATLRGIAEDLLKVANRIAV